MRHPSPLLTRRHHPLFETAKTPIAIMPHNLYTDRPPSSPTVSQAPIHRIVASVADNEGPPRDPADSSLPFPFIPFLLFPFSVPSPSAVIVRRFRWLLLPVARTFHPSLLLPCCPFSIFRRTRAFSIPEVWIFFLHLFHNI